MIFFGTLAALVIIACVMKIRYHRDYVEAEPLSDAPYGDSVVYLEEAKQHFLEDEPTPFYKPPLYLFLLTALEADTPEGRNRIRFLQLILGLGILVNVFFLTYSHAGLLAGTFAFLLMLFYGPLHFFETKLLGTVPALFLLLTGCTLLDRFMRRGGSMLGFATGLLFGLASLTWAANLVMALMVVVFLLYKNLKGSGWMVLGGVVLAVLPVAAHNLRTGEGFILISYCEGHTFLVGNNPNSRGIYNLPPDYTDGVLSERDGEQKIAERKLGRKPSAAEQRNLSYKEGLRYLMEEWTKIPSLLYSKLRFAVSSYEVPDNYSLVRERKRLGLMKPFIVPFGLLLLLGVFGLVAGIRSPRMPILLPACALSALLIVFYVSSRYRLPLAPFLGISGTLGLFSLLRPMMRRSRKRLISGIVPVVLLVLLTAMTDLPYREQDLDHGEATLDILLDLHAAKTAMKKKELEQSLSILLHSLNHYPNAQVLENSITRIFTDLSPEEQERLVLFALRIAPGNERVEELLERAVNR